MFFHSPLSIFILVPFSIVVFLLLSKDVFWVRKTFLLCFSLFFYSFDHPWFLLPLLWSALLDFVISDLLISQRVSGILSRKFLLIASISSNIALLFAFKYIPLLTESLSVLGMSWDFSSGLWTFVLPAGISFYTFQTLSFVFDAYRCKVISRVRLLDYLLYVCYFPQIVAGPILRPNQFFGADGSILLSANNSRIYNGFQRICFGLFLKLVLADELARLNDIAYSGILPTSLSFIDAITMGSGFGLQIYFDFSAYSHMAIGISECFGLPIRENFNFPYLSRSATEFWRRWHISLSTWVGDYLYSFMKQKLPLSFYGSLPLLFTWLIMGIWHGASWRFAMWGAINGSFILAHRIFKVAAAKNYVLGIIFCPVLSWLITNLAIMVSWVCFRSTSWEQLSAIAAGLLNFSPTLSFRENYYLFVFLFGVSTTLFGLFWEGRFSISWIERVLQSEILVFFVTTTCLAISLLFIDRQTPFIYFQF